MSDLQKVSTPLLHKGDPTTTADFIVKPTSHKTGYRTVRSAVTGGDTVSIYSVETDGTIFSVAQFTIDSTQTAANVYGVGRWRAVRTNTAVEVQISPE